MQSLSGWHKISKLWMATFCLKDAESRDRWSAKNRVNQTHRVVTGRERACRGGGGGKGVGGGGSAAFWPLVPALPKAHLQPHLDFLGMPLYPYEEFLGCGGFCPWQPREC